MWEKAGLVGPEEDTSQDVGRVNFDERQRWHDASCVKRYGVLCEQQPTSCLIGAPGKVGEGGMKRSESVGGSLKGDAPQGSRMLAESPLSVEGTSPALNTSQEGNTDGSMQLCSL